MTSFCPSVVDVTIYICVTFCIFTFRLNRDTCTVDTALKELVWTIIGTRYLRAYIGPTQLYV